jgi:hypothetical protein
MKRIGAWLPVVAFFCAVLIAQGVMIGWWLPDSGVTSPGDTRGTDRAWEWSGIVRSDGPIMERIPAPYIVVTVLGCAVIAMIAWSFLVRWTDIDEAL